MFYSELLLTKTGPLARVWLASNLDRKLTKQNVLQSNLEDNVKNIIGGEQAPIALRLSGQLLLGVVKIYNRKAKYLMDDCSEALLKIKMAFRPGNVDLPTDQSHKANPTALMLPDTVTELDLFAPLPDPEDILREPENRAPGQDPTLLDFGMSQVLDSQTPTRATQQKRLLQLDEDDLGLDLGLDAADDLIRSTPMSDGPSIEIGRRAPTPRRDEPTLLEDDDLGLDFGFGADTTLGGGSVMPTREDNDGPLNLDDDFQMGGVDENDEIAKGNAAALERADMRRARASDSPLSSVHSSVERELERTFQLDQLDETDPTIVQAAQRVKRRRVLRMDTETELHSAVLKTQQTDHSAITKAPSYLPRDPLLLQLMEMQRNGSFVSNLMGDGRMQGWAPELRGIFSVEVVRKAGDKKRKRDSGIVADVSPSGSRHETPQLEIPQDDDEGFQAGAGAGTDFPDITLNDDNAPLRSDRGDSDAEAEMEDDAPAFDVTEAPLLLPSQSGPVAMGTKQMVHRLRTIFAPDHPLDANEPPTPSKRTVASALFTDLCDPETTSRQEATKNFFELLVLGTKDAVKVEQDSAKELGMPIRIRGKRGLWGAWAELGATGELASQEVTNAAAGEVEVGA